MLTPVDVQNKVFKGGIGFDKKDVEAFMEELSADYAELYRSNVELTDKVATLDDSLQHYRSIEDSVQKSLTISEKAAEETINAANDKARQINTEAELKAESMLADAKAELDKTKREIARLLQARDEFVNQYKKVLSAQLQLCDGEMVDIDLGEGYENLRSSDSSGYGGLGSEGGLSSGGGYAGASAYDDSHERAAQEPAGNVSALNIDPFADAQNGGRFSSHSTSKKSTSKKSSSDTGKISLNMKSQQPTSTKVKRNFTAAASSDTKDDSESTLKMASDKSKTTKKSADKKTADKKPAEKKPAEKPAAGAADVDDLNAKAEKQRQALQKAQEDALKKKAEEEAAKAAKLEEAKKRAAAEVAERERRLAEEEAKSVKKAQEKMDQELQSTIQAVQAAMQKDSEGGKKSENKSVFANQAETLMAEQRAKDAEKAKKAKAASKDDQAVIDAIAAAVQAEKATEEQVVVGEVEDKIKESSMIDSEDNYGDGFDFVSEDDSAGSLKFEGDDDTYSGEVEDKVNESNMIDSEDNHSDGFDFLVDEGDTEEIPTINSGLNSFSVGSSGGDSASGGLGANLNFDSLEDDDDGGITIGGSANKPEDSKLIGGDDDDDGFNFL